MVRQITNLSRNPRQVGILFQGGLLQPIYMIYRHSERYLKKTHEKSFVKPQPSPSQERVREVVPEGKIVFLFLACGQHLKAKEVPVSRSCGYRRGIATCGARDPQSSRQKNRTFFFTARVARGSCSRAIDEPSAWILFAGDQANLSRGPSTWAKHQQIQV